MAHLVEIIGDISAANALFVTVEQSTVVPPPPPPVVPLLLQEMNINIARTDIDITFLIYKFYL
jgi:hypothetical protein